VPPQQSLSDEQVSPVCWQNEALWHVPFDAQNPEQQSAATPQGSPSVLPHPNGFGADAQVPVVPPSLLHLPLQHWMLFVHVWPDWEQTKTQVLLVHVPLQQSLGC
jgi:hypothetical protein